MFKHPRIVFKIMLLLPNTLGGISFPNLTIFDKAPKAIWSIRIYKEDGGWAIFIYALIWIEFSFLELFTLGHLFSVL